MSKDNPDYAEPPEPWPRIHGGADCDCHKNMPPSDPPPMRDATPEDCMALGVSPEALSSVPPGMSVQITAPGTTLKVTALSERIQVAAQIELGTGTVVPGIISAPTLADLNFCKPDGVLIASPVTLADHLYNLIQGTACPHYGRQMRYPGGLSEDFRPCGCCAVCRMKEQASELRSKQA